MANSNSGIVRWYFCIFLQLLFVIFGHLAADFLDITTRYGNHIYNMTDRQTNIHTYYLMDDNVLKSRHNKKEDTVKSLHMLYLLNI